MSSPEMLFLEIFSPVTVLKGRYLVGQSERVANFVQSFEEAFLGESIDLEGMLDSIRTPHGL
jgi:hypothetical protein